MARHHGWELPAHSFQFVDITVFFLLSVAFYAFFAPFLGKDIYEYVAIGIYSFLALCVFILYVRCTGIDPADPGILIELKRHQLTYQMPEQIFLDGENSHRHGIGCCSKLGYCLCGFLLMENCRKDEDQLLEQTGEDDALFCTLCNAEARKFSKHCRSCDKCVDGFDHYCRWLNNCVGRKNCITFVCLMASSLVWLVFECAVGVAVLVRCFVDRKATEIQITERLGDGFSRPPFATVVDEIVPHLDPGRFPSTVDPDAVQSNKGKKVSQRRKLANLDSNEAIKAGAKARASSSVLRPVGPKLINPDHLSGTTMSGKSSPASTRHGYHETNARARTSNQSSYPPSRGSRDDFDTCGHSISNLSSPLAMNLTPSPVDPHSSSNRDHYNPMYQSSVLQSPLSAIASEMNDNMVRVPARKNNRGLTEHTKSSVYWDPEAGRFISAATRTVGSSSQISGTELT